MRVGDYVMVQISPSARRRTLARVCGYLGLSVKVEIYRVNPDRVNTAVIPMAQICGKAPESDRLRAFRSLYEIKEARQRRERARVSVRGFAELVGVTEQTVKAAESGKRKTQARIRLWILEGLRRIEAGNAQ